MVTWITLDIDGERAHLKAERSTSGVIVSCCPAVSEALEMAFDAARPLVGQTREPGQIFELPESVARALHKALSAALAE